MPRSSLIHAWPNRTLPRYWTSNQNRLGIPKTRSLIVFSSQFISLMRSAESLTSSSDTTDPCSIVKIDSALHGSLSSSAENAFNVMSLSDGNLKCLNNSSRTLVDVSWIVKLSRWGMNVLLVPWANEHEITAISQSTRFGQSLKMRDACDTSKRYFERRVESWSQFETIRSSGLITLFISHSSRSWGAFLSRLVMPKAMEGSNWSVRRRGIWYDRSLCALVGNPCDCHTRFLATDSLKLCHRWARERR